MWTSRRARMPLGGLRDGLSECTVLDLDDRLDRVGHRCIEREPVRLPMAATRALVDDGKAFASRLRDGDRTHGRSAIGGPVTGNDVEVERP